MHDEGPAMQKLSPLKEEVDLFKLLGELSALEAPSLL
jgi:hypothetical protein